MILSELEVLIRQIELKYKRKFKSEKAGAMLASKSGRGMDFKEVRLYTYGDDTRFIDWNVTSRMGDVYVKVFHEENDRIVNLFLDISESMDFAATNSYTKFFIAFQFLAFVSLVSVLSGDKVNLILYSDKIEKVYTDLKTKNNAYKILKQIHTTELIGKKSNHLLPMEFLKDKMPRRSIAYIISDFAGIDDFSKFRSLKKIHELHGIRVFDTVETLKAEKVFLNFFIRNIERLGGSRLYRSNFQKESSILNSYFQGKLLNLRTDSELGKTIFEFLVR